MAEGNTGRQNGDGRKGDNGDWGGRRDIDEGRRRKEICGEWQREMEGSGETEIDIAGHEGKEKEICRRVGGIKEDNLRLG